MGSSDLQQMQKPTDIPTTADTKVCLEMLGNGWNVKLCYFLIHISMFLISNVLCQ